ncbi:hypothetical protein JCM11641_002799 [Rhodosporidiobolus odoratus]
MAPRFGGAPTCPTCRKSVYHAEQILGPTGQPFHKLCLKCTACSRLLEPRLLVDHDGAAYCKACHSIFFGAKGYGAGGALVGVYAPSSPSRPSPSASPMRPAAPLSKPDFDEDDTRDSPSRPLPSFASTHSSRSTPAVAPPRPSLPEPPVPNTIPTGPTSREILPMEDDAKPRGRTTDEEESGLPSPAARKPHLPPKPVFPSSTPAPASAPPTPQHSSPSRPPAFSSIPPPTSSPRGFGSTHSQKQAVNKDLCRRCGTIVYFAEEVRAVGGKWHKRCLRCTSCSTTLSPNTVTEKDGEPYCKKCYSEQFGLKGHGVLSVRLLLSIPSWLGSRIPRDL